MDLRERLIETVKSGQSVRHCARQFRVDYTCALKWVRQFRRLGHVHPGQQGGYRPCVLSTHTEQLLNWVEQQPDLTLSELRARLTQHGIKVGIATLWRFFRRHEIRFKKSDARTRARS